MRAHAAGKPVVAFKVGRSESGARSAVSHTGALAGSDAAYDALFRQFGVIRAERYSDLLDIPLALSRGRTLKGRRLAIITSTGGSASLLADAAGVAGFETPPPDEATCGEAQGARDRGRDARPKPDRRHARRREVGYASAPSSAWSRRVRVTTPSLSSLAHRHCASRRRSERLCASALLRATSRSSVLLAQMRRTWFGRSISPGCRLLPHRKVARRRSPRCAAPAKRQGSIVQTGPPAATATGDMNLSLRPGALNEAESKRLFARFGIPVTREIVAKTPAEAEAAAKDICWQCRHQGSVARCAAQVRSRRRRSQHRA